MKEIDHASINGVEIHNLRELDCDEDILYGGDVYLDGHPIGNFEEVLDGDMVFHIQPEAQEQLQTRVEDYLEEVSDEDDQEELPNDLFFLDLIELERYFAMFKEGLEEGYGCLLVNYTDEGVDIFSVESEEEIEDIVRENNFEDFQVFSEADHFVISC